MTSRSQNPELYHYADNARRAYAELLRRHGIDGETARRVGSNASSWTLRRFGKAGLLLLACDRVHSELVGRATGIWPAMLTDAIRDARQLGIPGTRALKNSALATDLAAWLKDIDSTVAKLATRATADK